MRIRHRASLGVAFRGSGFFQHLDNIEGQRVARLAATLANLSRSGIVKHTRSLINNNPYT